MNSTIQRVIEVLRTIFSPSFWRDFIAEDMASESRLLHDMV